MRDSKRPADACENSAQCHLKQSRRKDKSQLAGLIARGEVPFPSELSGPGIRLLATDVQRLRRERLMEFVAELIARDIHPL